MPAFRIQRPASIAVAGLAFVLAGCSHKQAPPPPPPAQVGVTTLATAAVTTTSELTGRVTATMTSDVRPQVSGLILRRLFTEGALVHRGQPLYLIDPRPYQAALGQARGQLESAQATLVTDQLQAERYQSLAGTQAVSRQVIDNAVATARAQRALVRQYQASVAAAQVNLDFTRVVSPMTGRIGRSAVTPGALVTADQTDTLATIQQLDPVYVDVTQSASQLLQLRRSLARGSVLPATAVVHLKLEDGSDYPQAGTIEFSEVTVDATTGTVTLRARFPNPQTLLLPGLFVRVETPQAVVPDAILAPQQGITRDARGNATALLVDAGNKVVQRDVVTGQAIGNRWLVTRGLKAGDRLIVEGTAKVAPGATVRPVAVKLD